ncbi:NEW3 domain-containing protein [Halalkalibaculum sp. DA3122]|uniref:COG1470 family protein n=1 Tax=Halalkalibaculum sp. DA3122 TaxID=3373607 RepID=UPI003753FD0E
MEKIYYAVSFCLLLFFIGSIPPAGNAAQPDQGIMLYTAYTSRSVTPGQTLNYDIEIINNTGRIQNVDLNLLRVPESWEPSFTSGANTIQQIAIKPRVGDSGGGSRTLTLQLQVPLKIEKGTYRFSVLASTETGLEYELPLRVQVTEQGIFETELLVDQANMEGYADSDFNYTVTINNQTAREQNYALTADAPAGWDVRFRSGGNYVTSVNIASNESKDMTVKATPSQKAEADTVTINIQARSGSTADEATLEAVIKGKYGLNLTTPSGRLSTNITAGSEKTIPLSIQNTGTVPLHDISMSADTPVNWNATFDEKEIARLDPGETATVNATVTASDNAIAGDYQMQITADTPEASSDVTFRVTVSKSITWGSIGIAIILIVLGGISYLFKRYGRR